MGTIAAALLIGVIWYRLLCTRRRRQVSRSSGLHDPLLVGPSAAIRGGGGVDSDLDYAGQAAQRHAQFKLMRVPPMGSPVGQTPAGNYVGLYWQSGRTHPIPAQALSCTPTVADGTHGTVDGSGYDDVGQFYVRGEYAQSALRLTKTYRLGTGNPRENLGHTVTLRLTLCELHAVLADKSRELSRYGAPANAVGFYGTWHVRTRHYNGDAEMVLWLPPTPVAVGYVVAAGAEGSVPIVSGVPVASS